ncbi:MAG: hypothetical protein ACHQEA_01875 [Gaiellales bacterium]|jgi:hypothetical protein
MDNAPETRNNALSAEGRSDRGGARTVESARQELTREIRWIRRGRFSDDVDAWFSRFAPVPETREDDYLIAPAMAGLSVKIRGGSSFDVKQYQGAVGAVDIPVEGPSRIDSWLKFSFPLAGGADPPHAASASAWRKVRKRRQICVFPVADARRQTDSPGDTCSVELTEVQALGDAWWTLGFEARGRGALGGIKRAVATVFDEPPPMTPAFQAEEAMSYAEWINELATVRAYE